MDAPKLSDELDRWQEGEGEKPLGSLIDVFGEKSFAVLFVVLMGVPALPLPTGGATHVLEVVTVLLAVELCIGRNKVWLPQRWCRLELGGGKRQGFVKRLIRLIRWLERFSRPRLTVATRLAPSSMARCLHTACRVMDVPVSARRAQSSFKVWPLCA